MGYYTRITETNMFISKDDFEYCYEAMCKLNDRDDLKNGGSWGGGDGISADKPRPKGMTYHPAKWFSWLDANYPEKCKTMQDILFELGFEDIKLDEDGNLIDLWYDNKTGDEALFLQIISPYVKAGSYVNWIGEDGTRYQFFFNGKEMIMKAGVISWQ
jgi:hypothetical protein